MIREILVFGVAVLTGQAAVAVAFVVTGVDVMTVVAVGDCRSRGDCSSCGNYSN